jgi:amidase
MQLSDLDATACAELVRTGAASPAELVDAAIARIEHSNRELGAVIYPMFDTARTAAKAVPPGPFRGVPILIKDLNQHVAGTLHTEGLLPLKRAGHRVPHDSHLVAALRRAGFVIVGKTNTSELGIVPTTESPAWPPTKNPYDLARSPGGSSGGSACAVATGMVPVAHATDTGGSIRIPASCCGLYGLKPSRGRVSYAPTYGELHGGLVCDHVVTRSVRDSAAILDLLAGPQPGDPYAAPAQLARYAGELSSPRRPLRIGVATTYRGTDGALVESHPDCVAAVAHAAQLLTALGHVVEPAPITALHDPEWAPRFLTVWATSVATDLASAGRAIGREIESHEVEVLTWALAELGRLVTAPGYSDAWRYLHGAARRIAAFFTTYDLWLTPTITAPPAPLGSFRSPPDDPLAAAFACAALTPFTTPFNATGQPACSLPLYRNAAGLPIGVQLAAAYGREDLLLRISAQLEAAQPFDHAATR